MKTIKFTTISLLLILINHISWGQQRTSVAILGVQAKNIGIDSKSALSLLRLEVEKTDIYEVADQYDTEDKLKRANIRPDSCLGKDCLVSAGNTLGVDKVITGTLENYGVKIVITLKMIDVKTGALEKTRVDEYTNMQAEIQRMMELSVKNLLGLPVDQNVYNSLAKFEAPIINEESRLNNSGPRFGLAMVTGDYAQRLQDPLDRGGFDAYPVLSQFGYQFETEYLSSGNFQGLFETLFSVTGLEQQMFIPSMVIMNGFRNNKSGLEFALGPNIGVVKKAKGYYDNQGNWNLLSDWDGYDINTGQPTNPPYSIVERIDKRGFPKLSTRLIIAVGKTFRSGYLSIPVNLYYSPARSGSYFGLSVGFNVKRQHKEKVHSAKK